MEAKKDDVFNEMLEFGFSESVSFISKIELNKSPELSIANGLAQIKLKNFSEAVNAVDDIIPNVLPVNLRQSLFEILLDSYINLSKNEKLSILLNSQIFIETEKTPKLDILAADAYIMLRPNHDPKHAALEYLLRLHNKFPLSIEVSKRLISVGFYDFAETGNKIFDMYIKGLIQLEERNHRAALEIFQAIVEINPNCIPALSKICFCANYLQEDRIFDSAAERIPNTDPEVIDLRAGRLKVLQKKQELEQMVLEALASNKNSPQNWLAFTYIYEIKGDMSRALHMVSHAIRLDPRFRRAYIRQGELRFNKPENQRKALESFIKAHQIREGLDTFSAIIHCLTFQQDWESASVYAAAACAMFPNDSQDGIMAQTLLGLSQKGIDQQKSIAILQKALSKDEENMEALGALVDISIEAEDFDNAIKLLNEHQTPKNDFFYNYKMGEVYGNKKDYEAALRYMQRANAIRPTNVRAREMMKQLEQLLATPDQMDDDQFAD